MNIFLTSFTLALFAFSTLAHAVDAPPAKLQQKDTTALQAVAAAAIADTDPYTGMQFVSVKGGCYQMGSSNGRDNENPVHDVCVNDFSIGKFEVTQAQWEKVMGSNPSHFSQCGPDCPVDRISWNDAQEFIGKLNARSGRQYRLPTEAEWEFAARSGGRNEKWAGTSDEKSLGDFAWFGQNAGGNPHKVGLKKANGIGIHDMSGNVLEWCQDRYNDAYYKASPKDNPPGADTGENRVVRGGSWSNSADSTRTAYRDWDEPKIRTYNVGMRVVLPVR